LTIIAQSSSITKSKADELLDQFEESLRIILKEGGRNVISKDAPAMNEVNGNGYTATESSDTWTSGSDMDENVQRGSFGWTKEAIQIRHEIASLADVDESQVHEISSVFELGLDSIDVIKLSSRLSKRGIAIPVSTIIKAQTIENMSTSFRMMSRSSYLPPHCNRAWSTR
jgi:ferricrocin synthase